MTRPIPAIDDKILSPSDLADRLAAERGSGRKIVFTNGCFDILHAGHVRYMEEARRQGDLLVVGLNSDASTRRLKGADRPVNELADRLQVVAALEAVSFATWFGDEEPSSPEWRDTPYDLILKLRPDVLVKGGDWKIDQIVGGREVVGWGGEVKSLQFVEGRSTTNIIRKIGASGAK